jgi:hypothetical protein
MIRVAGNQPPPPPAPPEELPEQPVKSLYTADKQAIMEAMNMIQHALMLLMEVCPPDEYAGEGEEEPLPGEEDTAGEEMGIPEEEV